jgi:hypothetical protein
MLVSQVLVCFHTIRKFPGLTLDELAEKMHTLYGDFEAVRFLIHGGDYSLVADRIRDLNCVEARDGRYYYNPETRPYSKDVIINVCIEMGLQQEQKSHGR